MNTVVENKNNWLKWLIILLVIGWIFQGIQSLYYSFTLDWCDCKKISQDAISYSVLRGDYDTSVDIDALEFCAEKTIDLVDLDLDPDEVTSDYISQVSYEVCKNGYYEGKGKNRRGKKYYD